MSKITDFMAMTEKEKNLKRIAKELKELKLELAEITEEYEAEENGKADLLTEALDALEDAGETIDEVLEL